MVGVAVLVGPPPGGGNGGGAAGHVTCIRWWWGLGARPAGPTELQGFVVTQDELVRSTDVKIFPACHELWRSVLVFWVFGCQAWLALEVVRGAFYPWY